MLFENNLKIWKWKKEGKRKKKRENRIIYSSETNRLIFGLYTCDLFPHVQFFFLNKTGTILYAFCM